MDNLVDKSGETLRAMRMSGDISATELVDACEQRIKDLNGCLQAFVATCFEKARLEAKEMDRSGQFGSLMGLPVAIKDLNDVAGLPTTFGSHLFEKNIPSHDDDITKNIRNAKAIVLGKTNVPEHGFGATTTSPLFGSTGNPFNPLLSAGASTGGGAAAVASGMVPYATGSDFAGSLRTPAAFCGITGIRPSNGIVGTNRRSMAWSSFDVEGPMARTAADCKRLLSAMSRAERSDPLTARPDSRLKRPAETLPLSTLRVAVSEDLGFAPMCKSYRAEFRKKISLFKNLFKSVRDDHPLLADAEKTFMTLRGLGFVADFGPMEADFGEKLGVVVLEELDRARKLDAEQIGWALKSHTKIFRDAINFFDNYDILITPAASVPPFPHADVYPKEIDGKPLDGYLIWEAISWGITITQCPAVVIPCGGSNGLPFGLQIVGPHLADGWLLDIANTLETVFFGDTELGRLSPNLTKLFTEPKKEN